ncbi:hypothetical protein GCM10010862_00530 [Devosia nitrariae]|uniref:Uncharacterized protein n=1 Tax=Devosia nitrariae TaxID=2071872 RepID=A0ABQ5VZE4_9HYPH|nr:hypothetical protein GCM10010862_00530 [Devosia nitrariae]
MGRGRQDADLVHPPPRLPHKGGGDASCLWHRFAKRTDLHLPPCGGGWEGGELSVNRLTQCVNILTQHVNTRTHRTNPLTQRVNKGG